MMRSQTDEMLAARWDKKPYLYPSGHRNDVGGAYAGEWPKLAPRVECIPSRQTWVQRDVNDFGWVPVSRPPVNPILVAFREVATKPHAARKVLDALPPLDFPGANPAQIDHARKVLTRLVALA